MRIAIFDDDYSISGALENIVAACFQNDRSRFDCEVFTSAEELLRELAPSPLAFHIYLLDIEMGEIGGLLMDIKRKFIMEKDKISLRPFGAFQG